MRRRQFLASVVAGGSTAIAGCGVGGGGTPADSYDIGMGSSSFNPRSYTVSVGDTVRWKNTNSRAHTVTAYESQLPTGASYWATGGFASEADARDGFYERLDGAIGSNDTYEHTFETAGDHHYFCIPHERAGMVGVVVVEP